MSDLIKARELIDEFVAGAADLENLVHALELIDSVINAEEGTEDDAPEVSSDDDEVAVDPVA